MAKFKKGDIARIIKLEGTDAGRGYYIGEIVTIDQNDSLMPYIRRHTGEIGVMYEYQMNMVFQNTTTVTEPWLGYNPFLDCTEGNIFKLKTNKQTIMNKVSNFAKKLINPELVTLIEAGLIDQCSMQLTNTGKDRLLEILFADDTTKAKLVAVAKDIVEENTNK